jgi:uroporphyrinogen decarboxylase
VISYDQFFQPPDSYLEQGDEINWWDALSRSTPNRMFRRVQKDGNLIDLWGHYLRVVKNPTGAYEEIAGFPLSDASVNDVRNFPWPESDWWNFDPIPDIAAQLGEYDEFHIRFRVGSVFEVAWQLCGMDEFMMNMALEPEIPQLIMDHITDVYVDIMDRVLEKNSDCLDMVYFYDDVATQNGLMISKNMWRNMIKPRHTRLIDVAKKYNKKIMYHCDGSVYPIIPELIDMGVDLLNPIQVDAKNMDAQRLKDEFGESLCFHGGVDNVHTLPFGTPQDVQKDVRERVRILGHGGGYVVASTHHIQSNTPIQNIDAMYDIELRRC